RQPPPRPPTPPLSLHDALPTCVLAEGRRDDDPPLAVRVRFMGARQNEMAEARHGGVRARAPGDLRIEVGPLIGREDGEAFAYPPDRKSTRLNSSHEWSSYAVFC